MISLGNCDPFSDDYSHFRYFPYHSASEVSRLKIKLEKLTEILSNKENQIEDLERQLRVAMSKSSVSDLHIVL